MAAAAPEPADVFFLHFAAASAVTAASAATAPSGEVVDVVVIIQVQARRHLNEICAVYCSCPWVARTQGMAICIFKPNTPGINLRNTSEHASEVQLDMAHLCLEHRGLCPGASCEPKLCNIPHQMISMT